jgi:Zn-dependent peptidase ImmA (M78 family)
VTIKDIISILEEEGINLEWLNLKNFSGLYVRIDNQDIIIINDKLKTFKEIKAALIHELGHYFTGTVYFYNMDKYYIAKCEYKALKWESMFLMPKEEIKKAIKKGITEIWELSEYFDVSDDMVRFRLNLPDIQDLRLMLRDESNI